MESLKIDNFKIRRLNDLNIVVEEYKMVMNKKTKISKKKWVILGYYNNFRIAVSSLLDKRLSKCIKNDLKRCHEAIIDLKKESMEAIYSGKGVCCE